MVSAIPSDRGKPKPAVDCSRRCGKRLASSRRNHPCAVVRKIRPSQLHRPIPFEREHTRSNQLHHNLKIEDRASRDYGSSGTERTLYFRRGFHKLKFIWGSSRREGGPSWIGDVIDRDLAGRRVRQALRQTCDTLRRKRPKAASEPVSVVTTFVAGFRSGRDRLGGKEMRAVEWRSIRLNEALSRIA